VFAHTVRRLVLTAVAPALLGIVTAAPAQAQTRREAIPEADLSSMIVLQTNLRRERLGCGPLTDDPELDLAAERQSWYMATTGNFSHLGRDGSTFVARARAAGYSAPSGENIAWGYDSATQVMDAWMLSPGHRSNILNCAARSIGIGVVYGESGEPYYTQLFGWL
jgi:uncharacterized protein YkwD